MIHLGSHRLIEAPAANLCCARGPTHRRPAHGTSERITCLVPLSPREWLPAVTYRALNYGEWLLTACFIYYSVIDYLLQYPLHQTHTYCACGEAFVCSPRGAALWGISS